LTDTAELLLELLVVELLTDLLTVDDCLTTFVLDVDDEVEAEILEEELELVDATLDDPPTFEATNCDILLLVLLLDGSVCRLMN